MNGLTDWLRHALPKPWLFGLYGALGGLIGALVLGEVLWGVLRPSTKAVGWVPPLRLAVSPSLDVYQEGKNQLGIKIAREGWVGPVTMTAVHPPPGIVIDPVIVPEDRSEMQIEVKATTRASIGSSEITLEAHGPPIPGSPQATASVSLTVRKAQSLLPGLRLSVSPEVVVDQAGENRFGVIIARDHFRGPVSVKLSELPEGVAARTLTLPPEVSEGEIEVRAGADATAGTTTVAVTATGPEGLADVVGPPSGFSRLSLRVNARTGPPPALRLGVSPGVVVDQTRKNRFGVVIARDHFSGPVTIEVGGLPNGVKATTLSLPADETRGMIEVEAAADAPVGTGIVSVTATGPRGLPGATDPPKAINRLDLTVKPYKSTPLKVDIMFVLDVTGSMQWAIDGVRDGIILFAEDLGRRQLDVRVGLTGFRDHLRAVREHPAKADNAAEPKKAEQRLGRLKRRVAPGMMPGLFGMAPMRPLDLAPRILLVNGEAFTKDYRAFGKEVGANLVAFGGGNEPESSLDALALASRQSFREDASRVLILITDAPPNIPDLEMRSIKQTLAALREAEIDQLHLVINDVCRPFYTPLQAVDGGGGVFDLQEAARGKGAFAALLPTVGQEIARITTASQPPPPPPTESQPPPPPPASVAAAPLEPNAALAPPPVPAALAAGDLPPISPPPVLRGVQSQETFGTESSSRLLVAIAVWTSAITAMIAMALCAGQHHYLRRGWLPPGAALRGWVGGLIAGLAGGAAGQFLFQVASGIPAGEAVFRVLGWTLLGSLAGYVLAFFVPNLRSDRGILGGAVGGAAGALGFLAAALAVRGLPGGDAAGRVLGAVLLGLALGLMLALAERIARKAWLEVQFGGGESRTVNLGVEPVSIGSNSRAATIYARGVAPVAYRYWFLDGKVKQHDVVSGSVTEVRPDDPQSVGPVIVTVRTAATTMATAPRPAPARVPVAPAPPVAAAPAPPVAKTLAPAPQVRPATHNGVAASAPIVPPTPASPKPAPVAGASASGPGVAPRKDTSSCPGCGRQLPGVPGHRYCIQCDLYL